MASRLLDHGAFPIGAIAGSGIDFDAWLDFEPTPHSTSVAGHRWERR